MLSKAADQRHPYVSQESSASEIYYHSAITLSILSSLSEDFLFLPCPNVGLVLGADWLVLSDLLENCSF